MKALKPSIPSWIVMLCCAALAVVGAPSPQAQTMQQLSLGDLVKDSSNILIATCAQRKTLVRNGCLVTHYMMKLDDSWKGQVSLDKNGEFPMEELGGELTGPLPLVQAVPGTGNYVPGQQVLMFAKQSPQNPATKSLPAGMHPTITPGLLRTIGGPQGHLTVVKHPVTGEPLVTHLSLGELGSAPIKSAVARQMTKDKAPATTGTTATETEVAAARKKAEVEVGKRLDELSAERAASRAKLAESQPARADDIYEYEPLSAVKARVEQLMKSSAK